MDIRHLKQEFIASIDKKDFGKLKKFLESLDLRSGNEEVLEHWQEERLWDIESEDDEHLIVVMGKKKAYVFLKKNKKFEPLLKKFLRFLPIPKPKKA
jgi:hypothetical protein